MPLTEINFDGIIGPSHNFSGLSVGNLAATRNAGKVSHPRTAALQGIDKMRANLAVGLSQGWFVPHPRPDRAWLAALGSTPEQADAILLANAMSASPMWAANAATVSPAPDTGDGRCHLTAANLATMPHRSHEWPATLAQLRLAFADDAFAVHAPVPPPFGDEGAANHMRLAPSHEAPGVEIFVYGAAGGPFPVRQSLEAARAVARLHRLDPGRTLFVAQSEEAIAAGAFHNDVVAVTDGMTLFCHEQAFADPSAFYTDLRRIMPGIEIVEVPAAQVSLADAIASYLFNSQLVTLPDGGQALIAPEEADETPSVHRWLAGQVAGNGPIRRVDTVDLRQSMANGGGPACLRLRVVADTATVDPRFMTDEVKLDAVAGLVEREWPKEIAPDGLGSAVLWNDIARARGALLDLLELGELR